ncbi:MAG: outer membrane beta-barrel protein, partial [Bacteroidia bacterium]
GSTAGITTTNMAGFNYADIYKNGTQFNASYNFNKTSLFVEQDEFRQNLLGNTTTTSRTNSTSTTDRLNHRLNFTLDTKLDSTISFRLRPDLAFADNDALNEDDYERNVLATTTLGTQRYNTNSTAPSIGNNLLVRKKFQRRGRTLSLNVNTNINNSEAENLNFIQENVTIGTTPSVRVIDQQNNQNNKSINNNVRLAYTEPLNKTLSLELNYSNGYSFDNTERLVYNYNPATQRYDIADPLFSNNFESTTFTNAIGFTFNKNEKKYNWNAGLAVQNLDQKRLDVTTNDVFNRSFINLTPSAQFRYNFSNSKRLRIEYNGRTQQPAINQIQPILDNTNTQSIIIGNADLKPAFANSLRVFYNNFDFASFRTLFVGAFVNQQFNGFATRQELISNPADPNYGKIATSYTNVDGNFDARLFGTLSQPIIKGNKLNLAVDVRGSYAKSTGFTNGLENVTNDYSILNGYKLVSNLDKFDLIAGISGTMFRATYSAAANNNTRYYSIAPNIDISYVFPGNIRLQTDLTYNKLTGRGEAFDTEFTMVNAYMSRQFFKNRGTFKLSVNDLLNENTGINRTSAANTIRDVNFNVLKRYYMFSFTYSLNKVAGRVVGAPTPGQGGQRNMRMGGMGF